MNNHKKISDSIQILIFATTFSPAFTSCSGRDSRFVESNGADSVFLYDWHEEGPAHIDRHSASNAGPRNIYSDDNDIVDRVNEGRMSGYCTHDDFDPEETDDVNFYDANSISGSRDEVSDEERDEIDEQYEE